MKTLYILFSLCLFLISCNGLEKSKFQKKQKDIPITTKSSPKMASSYNDHAIYQLPSYLLKKSRHVHYFEFDSRVRSIFEDSKGNFWFGTDKNGVYLSDGKSLQNFNIEDDLSDNQIRSIQEDKEGNIWFNTGSGICRFNGKKIDIMARTFNIESKSDNNQDWEKTPDDLWFDANNNGGTYRYNGKELTYLAFPTTKTDTISNSFNDAYSLYSIHKDNESNVWFGTLNKGVVYYDGKGFTYINEQNLNAPVRSIFQDADGNMWFGNNGGGIFKYDGKNLTNLTEEKGLTNYPFLNGDHADQPGTLARIWSINQDNDGNMWFGTIDAGVWKYDGKTLINYTKKDGLGSNAVEAIYKDKKGKLWFGSKGGVFNFNGKSFDRFMPMDDC